MSRLLSLLLATSILSACAVGPDYETPTLNAGEGWIDDQSVMVDSPHIEQSWWQHFNDPLLTRLIEEASVHNHDVRIALATAEEAKALRGASAAQMLPAIGASAGIERRRAGSGTFNSGNERDTFSAALDASWEPDLFGGIRRGLEAATAREQAATENHHDVMLSVYAELARNYYELRGTQARIALAKENIELAKNVESLANSLFNSGATSGFDASQARGERETIESQLPNLEAEMMASIYRISVLTGHLPEHHLEQLKSMQPTILTDDPVPVGLRSDILRRRPDVRRAELELAASTADIGVATAELFPKLPLTGSAGYNALSFGDLFASGGFTYFAAASLVQPIFEGGAIRASIKASDARAQAALANYEKTALTALEDAESSLVRYGKEWQTLRSLQAAETSRLDAYKIARLRYENGSDNFLVVLDAQRSLNATREQLVQSQTRLHTSLTQLYKSLGGGWEDN